MQSLKNQKFLYFLSHFLFVEKELFKHKGKRKKFKHKGKRKKFVILLLIKKHYFLSCKKT